MRPIAQPRRRPQGDGTLKERHAMPSFANPFAGNVDRKMTNEELMQALRLDIAGELEAIYLYESHYLATDDPVAKAVLSDIRDEEKAHMGELVTLMRYLDPKETELFLEGEGEVQLAGTGHSHRLGDAQHHACRTPMVGGLRRGPSGARPATRAVPSAHGRSSTAREARHTRAKGVHSWITCARRIGRSVRSSCSEPHRRRRRSARRASMLTCRRFLQAVRPAGPRRHYRSRWTAWCKEEVLEDGIGAHRGAHAAGAADVLRGLHAAGPRPRAGRARPACRVDLARRHRRRQARPHAARTTSVLNGNKAARRGRPAHREGCRRR